MPRHHSAGQVFPVLVLSRRGLWARAAFLTLAAFVIILGRVWAPRSVPATAIAPGPGVAPITRAPTPDARVALTFDITHGDQELREVLGALARHGVRATFFVSHLWAANHPELVLALEADGHEVGTLGFQLVDLTALTPAEVTAHLTRAQGLLFRILSRPARLFRPPMGRWNRAVLDAAHAAGLHTVTWQVDAGDGVTPGPPAAAVVRRVLAEVERGDIVRLHASDFSRQTAEALPGIIAGLRQRGLQPVPVRDLVE